MRTLENAVVRLLKRRPFYGHLLLGLRRRAVPHGIGLTIDHGIPTLVLAPEEFAAHLPDEQEALLEHLLKHLLHLHPLRRKEHHPATWDLACDLAINPGIAGLPLAAAQPQRHRLPAGWAAEEYYRKLYRPLAVGNLDGAGLGAAEAEQGDQSGAGAEQARSRTAGEAIDDHRLWREAESTPLRLGEAVVRQLVEQAWHQCRGEIPAELQTLIGDWLTPPAIPWPQLLRQFVATAGRSGRTSTWKREHRRFSHTTPGIRQRRRLNLLVAIDVSDSTDRLPLREAFARELLAIARSRDSRITVLYANSRIQRIATFTGSRQVAEVYSGGGFTDLRPVFAHARRMQPQPTAIIYLTDGYGEAPETPEYPTLWVLTADGRKPVPWGVELRLAE